MTTFIDQSNAFANANSCGFACMNVGMTTVVSRSIKHNYRINNDTLRELVI